MIYDGRLIESLKEAVERQEKLIPRSPEETERILRNQKWHYRRDLATDWNSGGCEAENLERSSPSLPDRSE